MGVLSRFFHVYHSWCEQMCVENTHHLQHNFFKGTWIFDAKWCYPFFGFFSGIEEFLTFDFRLSLLLRNWCGIFRDLPLTFYTIPSQCSSKVVTKKSDHENGENDWLLVAHWVWFIVYRVSRLDHFSVLTWCFNAKSCGWDSQPDRPISVSGCPSSASNPQKLLLAGQLFQCLFDVWIDSISVDIPHWYSGEKCVVASRVIESCSLVRFCARTQQLLSNYRLIYYDESLLRLGKSVIISSNPELTTESLQDR